MTHIDTSPPISKGTSSDTEILIKPNRNRQSLLLLLAIFALPIILAKLALEQQWLDFGVTNQGTLLENNLTLTDLGIDQSQFSQQWLIIYLLPDKCDQNCQKTLETVHNSYVAIGKGMPRITPVIVKKHDFSPAQSERILKSQWQVIAMPSKTTQHIAKTQILISDPLGNLMLSYDPITEIPKHNNVANNTVNLKPPIVQQHNALGKAIIADMKKLLKYSKVG
jgi:hypothetical protein